MKSHLRFSKQEQRGIFFLLLLIVIVKVLSFVLGGTGSSSKEGVEVVDFALQQKIDSLKRVASQKDSLRNYPFNPNFISDYKGYVLGMSTAEIDRLHTFRAAGNFVNSAAEFQQVTLVSDSLLQKMVPLFKFPEFTRKAQTANGQMESWRRNNLLENTALIDLNKATVAELKTVNGIGEKLSARIVKFRDRLGGFLVEDQIFDVYGLENEVAKRVLKKFKLLSKPHIVKININEATAREIAELIYIPYKIADKIVRYREVNGLFVSLDELNEIEDFPVEKIDRIKLYLTL